MTNNQKLALAILGYLPSGYVLCAERCNSGAPYRVGVIYGGESNFPICSVLPLSNGNLPTPADISA